MDSPSDGITKADYLGQLAPTYTQLVYNYMQANPTEPTDAEVTPPEVTGQSNPELNAMMKEYQRLKDGTPEKDKMWEEIIALRKQQSN